MQELHSFILLGKTGDGKSSLANFLSGTDNFKVYDGKNSGTSTSQEYDFSFENTKYKVIDTPGYFDSNPEKIENNNKEIINAIRNTENPISTILVVVNFQTSRIDENAQVCIEKISRLFPMKEFWKHVIIIFTKYYSGDPDDLEELKKNWENDINLFKKRIKDKNINNNIKINAFYIDNSKTNQRKGKNSNIRRDILNYIKNINIFYSTQYEIIIKKERVNLTLKNNEPDEKFGNIETRLFRSYSQVIYVYNQPKGKKIIQGPTTEIKRWTEKIEFFEKLDGIKKKKMKHFYIDNEFQGDYLESYEYLDINKIDHWEISCKCGFKDKTTYFDSEQFTKTTATTGSAIAGGIVGGVIGGLLGPVGWVGLLAALAGGSVVAGIGGGLGGKKIGEALSQSKNIGLDTFQKGCPKCGKIELDIIPIIKV